MAASYRKARLKDLAFFRLILIGVLGIVLLVLLLRTSSFIDLISRYSIEADEPYIDSTDAGSVLTPSYNLLLNNSLKLPTQNKLSISLENRNRMPPRNLDLFPTLAKDHVVIVLYVHNRPQYLRAAVDSLSRVTGISETLLIVSHDGYFEEMNKIVDGIKFCQVKQIFAPYSPHIFADGFPGISPTDCKDKENPTKKKCVGTPDQYGNHRSPKIVSLKHHWWWMMNTVWDSLNETRRHSGHILFIEEDHYIYPNAYRNLQLLIKLKPKRCPHCYAANLAPWDVKSRGEGWDSLIAERMGNVGYSFNRTVWRKIHKKAKEFCWFDDYNWDITMWATVYPSFGSPVYSLRAPRTSAVHFGKCGLHQGQGQKAACLDNGSLNIAVDDIDKIPNIKSDWGVHILKHQAGYQPGFRGWGGWGDTRDRQLCLQFARMYFSSNVGGA
ncbi:alpha-1,6-mannosyl-glycoprotein 2-beta-N-acetylglucosaminyltransferase-like [Andrographis paniculata]|uniref:alpha-1,6-mannosyl-glycoprotein 2-beta-N-acetylglucosaminyltransferase-like n=1 Tax=Andrographis paniculata TaxID=175694 RepID=UPI0021E7437B|nr:alpha-1,6-mannosyl-glycoprotein 2-beta-N-acetylglucosaminyltransferase-like [Andrographis paniculata]